MTAYESNIFKFEKPVKADTDDGYTKLANTLLDALCMLDVSNRKYRIILAVIRKTYGFNKKVDRISVSQLAEAINYTAAKTNLRADVRDLVERKILIREGHKIGPNRVISEWLVDPKTDQKRSPKTDRNQSPKRDRNQSVLTVVPSTTEIAKRDRNQSEKGIENDPHKRQKTKNKTKDLNTTHCARKSGLDFSEWESLGASADHIADWQSLRKQIKAPVTQIVITQFTKQFAKAVDDGQTVDACIELILVKAWRGFEYTWMQNHEANRSSTNSFSQPFEPSKSDTSWADGLVIDLPNDPVRHWDD